jgi:ferredoxin
VDYVYEQSGIKKVCAEEDVELVRFDKRRWRGKFPMTTWIDDCEHLVSVPKFKTHEFTLLTGAVKNLYGLVSGTYKTELHKKYYQREEFSRILVDIYGQKRPALSVVDGIVAMEGDGPGTSGTLRDLGLIIAGADGVAIDSVLAVIMGIKPHDVLTNREAEARGLGESNIANIQIAGEILEGLNERPFLLPAASLRSRIPQPVINLIKNFIRYRPVVRYGDCSSCGACIEACPNKAISRKNGKIFIDYSRCISCFCCQEACPNSALKVKKSLLARLTGL